MLVFGGGSLGDILGGGQPAQPEQQQQQQQQTTECKTAGDVETNRDCRWIVYENALTN